MEFAAFRYDIHQIVTVVSDARLPELEPFRVERSIVQPTIRVRIGKITAQDTAKQAARPGAADPPTDKVCFRDGIVRFGFGFGIEIAYGETIEVRATPLLARSPHVLYTNVVEPILRWSFVEHGYALVHGACLACDGEAFLVTARTDTGKTTTVLKVLDHQPDWAFLSDDLTLVHPSGRVLPYPKPLTISRHTLVAVKTPLLSWRERLTLGPQSRLHSKTGRRFGLFLAATRLPMATTNAIVQGLIPPPKYPVQRLVPGVRVAREARLAGMIVIERGGEGAEPLDHQQAVEILMTNSEDSYGFPPYPTIKKVLYGARGRDLQAEERATVSAALMGLPATLMRSESRAWWQQLPGFVDTAVAGLGNLRPASRLAEPVAIPAD